MTKTRFPFLALLFSLVVLASFAFITTSVFFSSVPNLSVEVQDNHIDPTRSDGSYREDQKGGEWNGQQVAVPSDLAEHMIAIDATASKRVLGETTAKKHIEVDLSNQTISAMEEDAPIYTFPISSGKWGRTPTGVFKVWYKIRSTRMEGGSKELRTYYNLPNVPYNLFFYNEDIPKFRGFAIHGAYWHDNFGIPMSHGCVNMQPEQAGIIYNWATPNMPEGLKSIMSSEDNPGIEVRIFGESPQG